FSQHTALGSAWTESGQVVGQGFVVVADRVFFGIGKHGAIVTYGGYVRSQNDGAPTTGYDSQTALIVTIMKLDEMVRLLPPTFAGEPE
ncbi:hypothetical protein EGI20_02925, partial [Aquitalea sp. S1-19]|nr:hypothetical protein [Aquitalea sp. S1-19]